ncbi:MAG: type II toxin-antitoxin system VapC family toxin [Actinomycetota bacterium]
MIVLDTSGILAAIDASQQRHQEARAVLEGDPGPFLLSPFVLAEVDYLLGTRVGAREQVALLGEVESGAYQLEAFGPEEVGQAARIVQRYEAMKIGLADASIVVIASRAGTNRVLTLDERHFRAIRPARGRGFRILPSELETDQETRG